jgi:hypothetical protein
MTYRIIPYHATPHDTMNATMNEGKKGESQCKKDENVIDHDG